MMFLILEFRRGTHISAVTKKNFISLLIIFSTEYERRIGSWNYFLSIDKMR